MAVAMYGVKLLQNVHPMTYKAVFESLHFQTLFMCCFLDEHVKYILWMSETLHVGHQVLEVEVSYLSHALKIPLYAKFTSPMFNLSLTCQ